MLLYGREIWVVTDAMRAVLESFFHRISVPISGMTEQMGNGREW